jgi:23S rRNA pseudouridine955/2504/2580 synthase/23S rRNA pseudouridine1911/1915/1917 synthase
MEGHQTQFSKWKVDKLNSGKTLLAFIKDHLSPEYSAKQIKKAIDSNRCQVNGRTERFSSSLVGSGDEVVLEIQSLRQTALKPILNESCVVLYQDPFMLAIYKPSGIPSDDLKFTRHLQEHFGPVYLAHRLDRDTTGVLLFARNDNVQEILFKKFKDHEIAKEYLCLVDGMPLHKSGLIENYLVKVSSYQGQSIWGVAEGTQGVWAKTSWLLEQSNGSVSLIRCYPATGRTHQIRVHMAHLGNPILGDHQYARSFCCSYRPSRVLLHAVKSSFIHPINNSKITIEAPMPQDMREAAEVLGLPFLGGPKRSTS